MLFTRKGDKGTTKIFSSKEGERISKSSLVIQALGTLDELNSFLGLCKVWGAKAGFKIKDRSFEEILHFTQKNLFIIQAELAGSEMTMHEEKLREIEGLINEAESELPPIKTFFISGGTELAALLDFARTLARRAERVVIAATEAKKAKVGEWSMAYLNRLSSLLYALARLANHKFGITEQTPDYR